MYASTTPLSLQYAFTFAVRWHGAESIIAKTFLKLFEILYGINTLCNHFNIMSSSNVEADLYSQSTFGNMSSSCIGFFRGTIASKGSLKPSAAAVKATDVRVRSFPVIVPLTRRVPFSA
jgi:hypothetical protein